MLLKSEYITASRATIFLAGFHIAERDFGLGETCCGIDGLSPNKSTFKNSTMKKTERLSTSHYRVCALMEMIGTISEP